MVGRPSGVSNFVICVAEPNRRAEISGIAADVPNRADISAIRSSRLEMERYGTKQFLARESWRAQFLGRRRRNHKRVKAAQDSILLVGGNKPVIESGLRSVGVGIARESLRFSQCVHWLH